MSNKDSYPLHLGLLAAMPEELGNILSNLLDISKKEYGDLTIFSGTWKNTLNKEFYITVAWSGWGKVSAARAATRIISSTYKNKKINLFMFTGVAGGVKKDLKQWDIVVADSLIQHDMDASPLFDKFVIPSLGKKILQPNNDTLQKLISELTKEKNRGKLSRFGEINKGLIATGDKFVSDTSLIHILEKQIPKLLAIEMEGAAFAQVAIQEKVDWLVIRVISDSANDSADQDFQSFLKEYNKFSWQLISCFLSSL